MRAIVCMDLNHGIGYKNDLLYKNKQDMKNFIDRTIEIGCIIMGNNTFKSIGSKPLKERINVVICTDKTLIFDKDGKLNIWNFSNINAIATFFPQSMVIGGEQIYRAFEQYIDMYYVTEVLDDTKLSDTFFPSINKLNTMAQVIILETIATDIIPAFRYSLFLDKEKYKNNIENMILKGEYIYNYKMEL